VKVVIAAILTGTLMLDQCWAEDWTVNGKEFHNVTVTKVEADTVSIMYDGGIGRVNLSDLSPELQKKFKYDPQAAAEAQAQAASKARASDTIAAAAVRANAARENNAEAVEELSKHPLGMAGTISTGGNGTYIVQADTDEVLVPVDFGAKLVTTSSGKPTVLNGAGGVCILVTNKTYTVDQKISLLVYPAGTQIEDGDQYARYSDDPATALKLSQSK
jgi:hypothetical protein